MRIQIGRNVIDLKFPKKGGAFLFKIALVLVLVLACFSAFYTVKLEEEALVLRFGKHVRTVPSGLHYKLPFGIEQAYYVPVKRQLKHEFGFGSEGAQRRTWENANAERELEKTIVTGDLNTALVEWVIQYRVDDPYKYQFRVRDPDGTLRDASESVMREVVGDRTVDEVITVGRRDIEIECRDKLNELVKRYELGIVIDQVQLGDVNPPLPVQASFNEVNQAQQDKEKAINVANGQYNGAVPAARGEAEQKISAAEGYATQRVNEAEGNAARFSALFAEYQKAPEVTRRRIYLETMEKLLPNLGRKVVLDEDASQVLPFLPIQGPQPTTPAAP